MNDVRAQDLSRKAGVCARTIQRWVSVGALPKPKYIKNPGGKGRIAVWSLDALHTAELLGLAYRLSQCLAEDPTLTVLRLARHSSLSAVERATRKTS